MAGKTEVAEQELKQVHEMFTDIWRFYKKYCEVSRDESYWQQMTDEAIQIDQRHNIPLCRRLLVMIMESFEEKEKSMNE